MRDYWIISGHQKHFDITGSVVTACVHRYLACIFAFFWNTVSAGYFVPFVVESTLVYLRCIPAPWVFTCLKQTMADWTSKRHVFKMLSLESRTYCIMHFDIIYFYLDFSTLCFQSLFTGWSIPGWILMCYHIRLWPDIQNIYLYLWFLHKDHHNYWKIFTR